MLDVVTFLIVMILFVLVVLMMVVDIIMVRCHCTLVHGGDCGCRLSSQCHHSLTVWIQTPSRMTHPSGFFHDGEG